MDCTLLADESQESLTMRKSSKAMATIALMVIGALLLSFQSVGIFLYGPARVKTRIHNITNLHYMNSGELDDIANLRSKRGKGGGDEEKKLVLMVKQAEEEAGQSLARDEEEDEEEIEHPVTKRLRIQSQLVSDALRETQLPDVVKTMLVKNVLHSLPTYADQRHKFQKKIVQMAGESLVGKENVLTGTVASAKSRVDSFDRPSMEMSIPKGANRLATLKSTAAKKEADFVQAKLEFEEAREYLKAVSEQQQEGDVEYIEMAQKIEKLYQIRSQIKAMEEETTQADAEHVTKVTNGLKEFDVPEAFLEFQQEILPKPSGERADFEKKTMAEINSMLVAKGAELEASLAKLAPGKTERAATVDAARLRYDAGKAKLDSAKADDKQAKEALRDGEIDFRRVQDDLQNFNQHLGVAEDKLKEAEAQLADFRSGPLNAFKFLEEVDASKIKAEEDAKAAEEARIRAEEEQAKAAAEARLRAEEEAKAAELARIKAEELAIEAARVKSEEEANAKATEEARMKEATIKAEEGAQSKTAEAMVESEAEMRNREVAGTQTAQEAAVSRVESAEEANARVAEASSTGANEHAQAHAADVARAKSEEEVKAHAKATVEATASETQPQKSVLDSPASVPETVARASLPMQGSGVHVSIQGPPLRHGFA